MRTDLYARKSSSDLGRSVARQERTWRADCEAEGLEPGRVFVDPDFSASQYARKDRPDYTALLEHIRAGETEMVSLWEVTRGSRQMGEWVTFLDLCREKRVMVRVFGDGEDAFTYRTWVQRDRDSLMKEGIAAESEVERIRTRTRAGTADAAHEGRPPGPLLDGYVREYGALTGDSLSPSGAKRREIRQVIDEPRAAIYRAAAEGVINGVPLNFIVRVLTAWGIPTASGGSVWQGTVMRRMLLNPGMQGHRVLAGKIVRRDAWPAIFDPVTAARVREILTESGRRHRSDGRLKYMLTGALKCGACRHPMGSRTWSQQQYQCAQPGCSKVAVSMRLVEDEVSRLIVARLIQHDAMSAPAFAATTDDSAVRAAKAELAVLASRRDELYREAAKPDGPSLALVAAAERELLPRIDAMQDEIRRLTLPPVLHDFDPQDLARRWDSGYYAVGDRRAVVMGLADLVLSPVGKAGRWSRWRLAESRWRGDALTWGERWGAEARIDS